MTAKNLTGLALVFLGGIVAVAAVTSAVSIFSGYAPAKPAVYFILWAFVLVPIVALIVGALAAREEYFACRGPNYSILVSTVAAVVSAVAGIALWQLAAPAAGMPDFIRQYLDSVHVPDSDLAFLLVVYGLAGAIGGVVDYYFSQGRTCDVRPAERK